jgi:iron complex transport system substrate-binding protein
VTDLLPAGFVAFGSTEEGRAASGTTIVLDTSVLIADPCCVTSFGDQNVVIPLTVVEELDGLKTRAAAATEGVDFNGATVAFWFADTKTPYMAGGLSAAGLLAKTVDLDNVFSSSPEDWPATTWEAVADRDPHVLVLGDLQRDRFPGDRLDDKISFLESDPLTQTIDAVRNKRYIVLHGAELNPSIRFVDGLEKIQSWLREHKDEL